MLKGFREHTNIDTNVAILEVMLLQNLKNIIEMLSWGIFLNLKCDHRHGKSVVPLVIWKKLSPSACHA